MTFVSFEQLKKDFGILNSDIFRYLQIRSFVKTNFSLVLPQKTWLDECLELDPSERGQPCTTTWHTWHFLLDSVDYKLNVMLFTLDYGTGNAKKAYYAATGWSC